MRVSDRSQRCPPVSTAPPSMAAAAPGPGVTRKATTCSAPAASVTGAWAGSAFQPAGSRSRAVPTSGARVLDTVSRTSRGRASANR